MTFREQLGLRNKWEIQDLLKTVSPEERIEARNVMYNVEQESGVEIWGVATPKKMFELIMKTARKELKGCKR